MIAFTLDVPGVQFDLYLLILITVAHLAWRGWRWLNQLNSLTRAQRQAARPWEQKARNDRRREARHG